MTSTAFALLARRRTELIARSTVQRDALSKQSQSLEQMMSTLDHGIAMLRNLKNHPLALAGTLVGLVIIKPRRLLPLLRNGLLAWQTLRTFAPLLHERFMRYREKPGNRGGL
ncbi:MAG: YqjK family protein [Oxalobacteraceae bacterium]